MFVHFPKTLRARWFEKSADAQVSGMEPGPHSGGVPSGVSKILSINASSIVLRLSLPRYRHAVPLKITCNQINFLRNHDGTKSEDELLGNAFLFVVNVADV